MLYLVLISFVWAFSFGLTKNYLTGLDSNFVSFARLAIATLCFLPFLRLRSFSKKLAGQFLLIGAVEFGIMYLTYNAAFQYLKAYEVALFTIFTPIYVTLINDLIERKIHRFTLFAVLLATFGTAVVRWNQIPNTTILGFLLVQVSNLGFALGLIFYRRVMSQQTNLKDPQVFGLLYLGGTLLSGIFTTISIANGTTIQLTLASSLTLVYLGAIASGLGFFLWNVGSRQVSIGAMAIFNDLKVPLAVVVSLLFFGEKANLMNLIIGGVLVIASLLLNEFGPGIFVPFAHKNVSPEKTI
jgi:drug/metabolite transporter (DMT)-like permease